MSVGQPEEHRPAAAPKSRAAGAAVAPDGPDTPVGQLEQLLPLLPRRKRGARPDGMPRVPTMEAFVAGWCVAGWGMELWPAAHAAAHALVPGHTPGVNCRAAELHLHGSPRPRAECNCRSSLKPAAPGPAGGEAEHVRLHTSCSYYAAGAAGPGVYSFMDAPAVLRFNKFVRSGYRAGYSYRQCCASVLRWHNETGGCCEQRGRQPARLARLPTTCAHHAAWPLHAPPTATSSGILDSPGSPSPGNIWTHLLPALLLLALLAGGQLQAWQGARAAFLVNVGSIAACFLGSVGFHTFMAHHHHYHRWLCLDVSGTGRGSRRRRSSAAALSAVSALAGPCLSGCALGQQHVSAAQLQLWPPRRAHPSGLLTSAPPLACRSAVCC